ncbi:MAG TPA: signal peptidase I [Puia sp.]|nr:signal peptidase I [Puia sp.]
MKKYWWLFLIGGLTACYIIFSFLGILRFYYVPTGSNEPNIRPRAWILATRLSGPKPLDFICYHHGPFEGAPASIWVKRLCGIPGDTVKMVDGILWVNGHNADSSLNLKMGFVLPAGELKKLGEGYFADELDQPQRVGNNADSVYANIGTTDFRKDGLKGRFAIDTTTIEEMKSLFGKAGTRDNFGPFVVPPGKFFVLGDNRHSSADSRYTGFIDRQDYRGTVCGIY